MSLINLAKAQEESKLSKLDEIVRAIDSKNEQVKAPILAQKEASKQRLSEIKREIKRQKINKDILKEILDMREESMVGKAVSGNVPVAPDAEGLPMLDQLANRR